ncbi:MAG: hypothetical protein H6822_19670 [Planctomycetaceae bacterium]|nr:hypothetical protein [Planctomycetaceae bacterium]
MAQKYVVRTLIVDWDKEKAEVILELSKKATERFDKRKEYEWKLSFGLWLAFGSAAGLVWQAESTIPVTAFLLALLIIIAIVVAYYLLIIHWMDNSHRRDLKTSYYWETVLSKMVGVDLCPGLGPTKNLEHNDWPTYPGDVSKDGTATQYFLNWKVFERFHYAGAGQLAITVLLAFLLTLAISVKTFSTSETSNEGSLKLEGQIHNKVTIEK